MAAGKALSLTARLLEDLQVHGERMRHNLEATNGHAYSEAVMLALAARLGKQTAYRLVHRAATEAARAGRPLRQAIAEDPDIAPHLPAAEIDRLFDAGLQTAQCGAQVDLVLASEA
jgi:adenylosuccinate lyase